MTQGTSCEEPHEDSPQLDPPERHAHAVDPEFDDGGRRVVGRDPRERTPDSVQAELLRATERDRLRALVEADLDRARELHADDFQLITPLGYELSKDEYLGGIASGDMNYVAWDAGPIEVRLYAENTAAVIRYRSELEIVSNGHHAPRRPHWHTDLYEQRDGRWQVIWSHATRIA